MRGTLLTLLQYMYREDEWKMSGYKTTYNTDEKQLYIPQKFSNLSEPSLRSCSQNISNFLYISDVNSYYILVLFF